MVADACNRHSRRYIGLLLAWAFACYVMPPLASAAEDDLLTIEPTVSMQQMRQRHDPALQAILHVPAFGTLHLAHARAELLSDRADAIRIDLGDGRVVIAHKVRFHVDADGVAVWEGEIQAGGSRARGSSEKEVPFDENNGVTLAALRGRINGSLRVAGQLYKIMPLSQGEHVVVKVDDSKLSEGDDTEAAEATEQTVGHPSAATRSPHAISTIRVRWWLPAMRSTASATRTRLERLPQQLLRRPTAVSPTATFPCVWRAMAFIRWLTFRLLA